MQGLTNFISDLRKCIGKEEELIRINKELINIRTKFKRLMPVNGYQQKKYLCKLLYIFLLGHNCDFGHLEAVNLLSSNVYSEKRIGYLFLSVVGNGTFDFTPLIINAINDDLRSQKDVFQNLALQFVANNGNIKMADSLADPVIDVLLAKHATIFVKQTAALSLLHLLRMKSDLSLNEFQRNSIIALISHDELGIVITSASLIEYLAKHFTLQFESCVKQCIGKLDIILNSTNVYYIYDYISAPWIVVKLLRILKNYFVPFDLHLKRKLRNCLQMILNKANDSPKLEKYNAKFSMIYEAISLAFQMEFDNLLFSKAITILVCALHQTHVNHKFIALDMMTQLSQNGTYQETLKSQWKAVLDVVQSESDISIKKSGLDFLYASCDSRNVKPVVEEMLYFLKCECDYSDDVILKTAALAEQFSSNQEWYFDTILKMLQLCGDRVDEGAWHSVVKIVIDNEALQEYAARASYAALHQTACYDVIVKLAGYVLGEFGYLIANDPQTDYLKQLSILREKLERCTSSTKALLLTVFMKFLNLYPDIKDEIQAVFRDKNNIKSENEEIQQRTVEYLRLSETANKSLLIAIFDNMPSSSRELPPVAQVVRKSNSQELTRPRCKEQSLKEKDLLKFHSQSNLALLQKDQGGKRIHFTRAVSHSNLSEESSSRNSKLQMNLYIKVPALNTISGTKSGATTTAPKYSALPNNWMLLHYLLFTKKGKLYEDHTITVLLESEFRKQFGRFLLKYINKTSHNITDFSVKGNFASVENKCLILLNAWSVALTAYEIMEQDILVECLGEFSSRPSLNLTFTFKRQQHKVKLELPLTINKFVGAVHMTPEDFRQKWKKYDSGCQEVIKEFTAKYPIISAVIREKLEGFRVSVIENQSDVSTETFYCAGIFYTRVSQTGFLIRLEKNPLAKKYRSSVRSAHHLSLSQNVSNLLCELL